MTRKSTFDNRMPCRAERQKIRERAELILAEARLLCEHLDRTGQTPGLSLQDYGLSVDPSTLGSLPNPYACVLRS